tara:strand:- start:3204 stop:4184 length:981 start_codon:yes stop_codon:yes gene_type:complete
MKYKLNKRYVIGIHVMFFEIEMFKEYVDGLLNLLNDVTNKDNIVLDFCFNTSEHIEKIDTSLISKTELISKFKTELSRLHEYTLNVKYHDTADGFYYHADYRRDLNYNYCKKVDYIMWGETDSLFPKEALQVIERLSTYTDEQGTHRYILSFADRKMWDASWDPLVHPKFVNHTFIDDENGHLNPNQAKSQMSILRMNEINAEADDFDIGWITEPKISGSCLVLSADLIKSGVNVPSCLIYNDDEGLSIMAKKLLGDKFIQFICKNILHVHARRHPQKRLYVANENNPHSFAPLKHDKFKQFKKLSQSNINSLITNEGKFYEYTDY